MRFFAGAVFYFNKGFIVSIVFSPICIFVICQIIKRTDKESFSL